MPMYYIKYRISFKAYYNHTKLFTRHFIQKILFVVKRETDIMKHPVGMEMH